MRKPGQYIKASLAPTAHPATLEIAWAAGIIEGEGTLDLTRSKPHLQGSARVSAVQKKPWCLEKLRALFGGSLYTTYNRGLGEGYITRWMLTGTRARGFIMTIYSFLSPHEQEKARLILTDKF